MKRSPYREGSITVEASFVVPIFILAAVAFLYLFEAMVLQNSMQDELAASARCYAYNQTEVPFFKSEDGNLHLITWHIESGEGYCETDTRQSIPGLPSWFLQIHLYQRIQVNAYQGTSMLSESTESSGEYVYLAENGRVYHRRLDCTYLHLGIQTVAGSSVADRRNQSGGKYRACESCAEGREADECAAVYITPYGARYHLVKDCPGLRRTVRKVLLSAVGALPPCSKCGGDM